MVAGQMEQSGLQRQLRLLQQPGLWGAVQSKFGGGLYPNLFPSIFEQPSDDGWIQLARGDQQPIQYSHEREFSGSREQHHPPVYPLQRECQSTLESQQLGNASK